MGSVFFSEKLFNNPFVIYLCSEKDEKNPIKRFENWLHKSRRFCIYYYNIICAYMKSSAANIMTRRHRRHRFLVGRHRDLSQKCTPLTDRVYVVHVCYIVALCHRTIFIFQ